MPWPRTAAILAVAAVVLASCSNSQGSVNRRPQSGSAVASEVNGVQQVTLTAGDDYRFHPSTFTVHPGRVEVFVKNTGSGAPHNFLVVGFPATFVPDAGGGQTSRATFDAPSPGKYKFECTIHVVQGQVGTMIVTKS